MLPTTGACVVVRHRSEGSVDCILIKTRHLNRDYASDAQIKHLLAFSNPSVRKSFVKRLSVAREECNEATVLTEGIAETCRDLNHSTPVR